MELPKAAEDFRKFLTAKALKWESEEMIDACTVIAQDPCNLRREYLALVRNTQECGEVWSGRGLHAANFAGS